MRTVAFACGIALALSLVALASPARASAFGLYDVNVQTRDGSRWSEGAPIVLVVRATSTGVPFPDRALSVVMQTDGDRTKCLNVAMKLVSTDSGIATYAGVFHPFRAATYDGRFAVGDDVFDIRFTVTSGVANSAAILSDAELPVLGPVRVDYGPAIDARLLSLAGAGLIAVLGLATVFIRRRLAVAAT